MGIWRLVVGLSPGSWAPWWAHNKEGERSHSGTCYTTLPIAPTNLGIEKGSNGDYKSQNAALCPDLRGCTV